MRSAMHEFALLARIAGRPVGADHQDFGVRNRLADRIGPAVDLGRIEVGRSERLGESVHEKRFRRREHLPQLVQGRLGHPAAGVGEVAQ